VFCNKICRPLNLSVSTFGYSRFGSVRFNLAWSMNISRLYCKFVFQPEFVRFDLVRLGSARLGSARLCVQCEWTLSRARKIHSTAWLAHFQTLKTEAENSTKASVIFYQTARLLIREDSLYSHRCENLRPHASYVQQILWCSPVAKACPIPVFLRRLSPLSRLMSSTKIYSVSKG
jgi:hypothetical protein